MKWSAFRHQLLHPSRSLVIRQPGFFFCCCCFETSSSSVLCQWHTAVWSPLLPTKKTFLVQSNFGFEVGLSKVNFSGDFGERKKSMQKWGLIWSREGSAQVRCMQTNYVNSNSLIVLWSNISLWSNLYSHRQGYRHCFCIFKFLSTNLIMQNCWVECCMHAKFLQLFPKYGDMSFR